MSLDWFHHHTGMRDEASTALLLPRARQGRLLALQFFKHLWYDTVEIDIMVAINSAVVFCLNNLVQQPQILYMNKKKYWMILNNLCSFTIYLHTGNQVNTVDRPLAFHCSFSGAIPRWDMRWLWSPCWTGGFSCFSDTSLTSTITQFHQRQSIQTCAPVQTLCTLWTFILHVYMHTRMHSGKQKKKSKIQTWCNL